MNKEIWKKIKGYNGFYEISNFGNLRSKRVNPKHHRPKTNGYLITDLCKNNKKKTYHVHRLVAKAFIPNPNNLPTVNHKDGNKQNNCLKNLEWMSYSDNNKHALKLKLRKCEFKIKENEKVFILRLIKFGFSQKEVAEIYNVTQPNISYILKRNLNE